MNRKTNDIFERLAQSVQAKKFVDPEISFTGGLEHYRKLFGGEPNRKMKGYPGTLERFADELRISSDLLIDQFKNAGIQGLKPENKIGKSDKEALLIYLRAIHGVSSSKPVTLYSNESPLASQIEVVQDANEEIIRLLASDPSLMYQLNPRKFEEVVARLFEKRGYVVTLTPPSKDGGFDFFAELKNSMSSFLILGECKRYSRERKVGVEVVRGLHSVIETRGANQGIIITSSFFTAGAQEHQRLIGSRMGLKNYNDLVTWLQPHIQK